jgi:hypothetical protein
LVLGYTVTGSEPDLPQSELAEENGHLPVITRTWTVDPELEPPDTRRNAERLFASNAAVARQTWRVYDRENIKSFLGSLSFR